MPFLKGGNIKKIYGILPISPCMAALLRVDKGKSKRIQSKKVQETACAAAVEE